jgi:hypothetical protein
METKIASSLRLIVCAVACLAILPLIASTRSAHAFFRNYNEAWCAQMGDGIEDCSYYTWQQCRAAASGTGNLLRKSTLCPAAAAEVETKILSRLNERGGQEGRPS